MFLSFQTGFNLVGAAVVCAILESISELVRYSWARVLEVSDCFKLLSVYFNLLLLFNQRRKSRILPQVLFSEHHAINTAHPSYSNFIGFRFLNTSNTKLPVCVTAKSLVPPPLTFLNYCSCTALPAVSALHQTHAYSNSDASTAKLMAFALSPISVHIAGTTSPMMSDTLVISLLSKSNSRQLSSLNISTEYHCPSPQRSV